MTDDAPVIEGQLDALALIPEPTMDGCVHGILSLNPVRIQCDGCLHVYEGDPGLPQGAQIILSRIRFSSVRYDAVGDKRRLCEECGLREWGKR